MELAFLDKMKELRRLGRQLNNRSESSLPIIRNDTLIDQYNKRKLSKSKIGLDSIVRIPKLQKPLTIRVTENIYSKQD
jgi:hypothetical protein